MAKLILTDKEKADPSYLDWDDEALGKLVRYTAQMLRDELGQDATFFTAGSQLVINAAIRAKVKTLTQTIEITVEGEDAGDWELKVTRVRKPNKGKIK